MEEKKEKKEKKSIFRPGGLLHFQVAMTKKSGCKGFVPFDRLF